MDNTVMDADSSKRAYMVAIVVQMIYTGMSVISKAAFNAGMNTFVFVFYRQAIGSLLLLPLALFFHRKEVQMPLKLMLKLFSCALAGNTLSLNLCNVGLKFTSATVASASGNTMPVITFCLALLLRMEMVKLRSASGVAKMTGALLCLAGVVVIALYTGPALSPVNDHRAFAVAHRAIHSSSKATWIIGAFLMVLANAAWSLSIVWQAALLKEFPNRMLVATALCVFSAAQSFIVAAVAERDFSRWRLHLDISLLAVTYAGLMVTGVTYYLQAWCVEMKGPVFFAIWTPLCFVLTIFCSSFFLGEIVHLGSIVGGILLAGGLYSVLWGKSMESDLAPCNNMNPVNCEHDHHNRSTANPDKYELDEVTSVRAGEGV